MEKTRPKRPIQITVVAVLWLLTSLWSLWLAIQGLAADLSGWHLLSDPTVSSWFRLAGPAELCINVAIFAVAVLLMTGVYGLSTGKRWSKKLILSTAAASAIPYLILGVLYVSAPSGIAQQFGAPIIQAFGFGVVQVLLAIASWRNLNTPEANTYLGLSE